MTRRTALSPAAVAFCALLSVNAARSFAQDAATQPTAKYEADWTHTNFNLVRTNPARNDGRQGIPQPASINLQIDLHDLGNVIGYGRGHLVITRMLDGDGQDVTPLLADRKSPGRHYQPPDYQVRPDRDGQRMNETLMPIRVAIPLNVDSPLPGEISVLEGYVPVLIAESTDHVDVPFKVSNQATEIVPGLRLRFSKAEGKPQSYNYSITTEDRDLPREERYHFTGTLDTDEALPQRIVIDRYLIDDEGNRFGGRNPRSFSYGSSTSASGGGGGDYSKATAMRFAIAMNAREARLPISVRNIDLPTQQAVAKLLPAPTPLRDLEPIDRMEERLGRHLKKRRTGGDRDQWNDAKDARVRELWDAFKKDHGLGVAAALDPAEIMGIKPDVMSYESYLGIYRATPENGGERFFIVVRKDELGRLLIDTPEGTSPAVARGGALFAVFDDVMIAREKPLDPDSPPKLAGIWIVQSKGGAKLITDSDRPHPDCTLDRVENKPAATQPTN